MVPTTAEQCSSTTTALCDNIFQSTSLFVDVSVNELLRLFLPLNDYHTPDFSQRYIIASDKHTAESKQHNQCG